MDVAAALDPPLSLLLHGKHSSRNDQKKQFTKTNPHEKHDFTFAKLNALTLHDKFVNNLYRLLGKCYKK